MFHSLVGRAKKNNNTHRNTVLQVRGGKCGTAPRTGNVSAAKNLMSSSSLVTVTSDILVPTTS